MSIDIDDIIVLDEYLEVKDIIENNDDVSSVFVTGDAGTGKSTFINYIREQFDYDVPVLAPTGVSALNVSGQTIHSFFGFPAKVMNLDEIKVSGKKRDLFKNLKVIIIDEISMVRADMMDAIDVSLRLNTKKFKQVFGGVKLIFVGDLCQLPPVIASREETKFIYSKYNTPYFLSSKCMRDHPPKVVQLSRVFRQKDPEFISLLSNIRLGNDIESTVEEFNDKCYDDDSSDVESDTILTADNFTAKYLNDLKLSQIDQEEETYYGTIIGKIGLPEKKLPAPTELILKVGAKVMFVRNDIGGRKWVNGTVGTIVEMNRKFIKVNVSGRVFSVNKITWDFFKYTYSEKHKKIMSKSIGSYTQFPLMLAWAITIHKSQGKTFDSINLNASKGMFAEGQLYVALSRCRELDGIKLDYQINEKDVKVNDTVSYFYNSINSSNDDKRVAV